MYIENRLNATTTSHQVRFAKRKRMSAWLLLAVALAVSPPALCMGSAARAENPVHWPNTIAGKRAKALIDAVNEDGVEPLRQFVRGNYSAAKMERIGLDDCVAKLQTLRKQLGKLEVGAVREDRRGISVVVRATAIDIWMDLRLTL